MSAEVSSQARRPGPGDALSGRWRRWWRGWLDHRLPAATRVRLGHRSIFILPGRQGAAFGIVLLLMFVAAVNYQISLAYALVFLLTALYLVSLLHAFRNLAGLRLAARQSAAAFAGGEASIDVLLRREGARCHEALSLGFPGGTEQEVSLVERDERRVTLTVPAPGRGWLEPGRLRVSSWFPFGLCRAWSLVAFDLRCLVYPRPEACDLEALLGGPAGSGRLPAREGQDDFRSLREFRRGDSLRHVAWKQAARGQGLHIKEYASEADPRLWLDPALFPGLDIESRLSRLCWCVLQLEARGTAYGLRLPGLQLPPARGEAHARQVLEALALFQAEAA